MTITEPVSSTIGSRKLIRNKMQNIKKVLGYTRTIYGMERITKRAWAEYFEMERKLVRYQFVCRLCVTFVLAFLMAFLIDKI